MIELAVFLGNPGSRYARTRHNIAMRMAEAFAERRGEQFQQKFQGRLATIRGGGGLPGAVASPAAAAGGTRAPGKLLVLLPETYMNRSGESAGACARYHSIDPRDVLVAHDEVELPFGTLELRRGGGLAGHNGLRSVAQHLSSKDFARLRIGIGRPRHGDVSSHVLGNFSSDEEARLDELERGVEEIIERLTAESFEAVTKEVGRRVVFEY
ncbi:MAG: aminoacyl-tRNA hydrolase [Spirochaetes bacterium]|jgi:PTH1 family peptidyl-tRNA hydrolase|nr:aminoacyl-tRNA hydrolase [Spirochaetota bacterium]